MNDYREHLTGTDRLTPKMVAAFTTAFTTADHDAIAIASGSSRTYVRDIVFGRQPVRQPKARLVLSCAIARYKEIDQ